MKKFFLSALIVATFVTSAIASTHEKISSKAAAHLAAHYADAKKVSWTVSDHFEKASITMGNEKVDVYYDGYGTLLGSTKTMAFDKLPKSALDVLTTEYSFPDYQLTDCIEYTDADNNRVYYISFDVDGERIIVSVSGFGLVSRV